MGAQPSKSKLSDTYIPPSKKHSSSDSEYAKEVAAYQQAVYNNPRPSHEILSQLHLKVDHTEDHNDPECDGSKMQHTYANSIAVLNTFWKNNVNTLSDDAYSALALNFYTNAYSAMPDAQPIFKSRIKKEAAVQSKIFFGMFGWLIFAITQPDSSQLTRKLSVLGKLHDAMGVKLAYYLQMGGAFHQTMEKEFDKRYTLRVRFCFNTLYEIVVNIMLGLDFRNQCAQQKDKISDFMEHINDVRHCLNDDSALGYLTLFMKQQFCDELALYYKDYKTYKCCKDQQQRDVKGEEMKRLYIDKSSERQINISFARRRSFNATLSAKGYDASIFDSISEDVVDLIRRNCFTEFQAQIQSVYEEMNDDKENVKTPKGADAQNWNFLVNRLNQTADSNQS